jgi:carbonic anhydrase/acetyltransferase-like protein (isoleucine patch superfamily)
MSETRVGEGSEVHMAIVDEEVDIGKRAKIGQMRSKTNKITVLGKRSIIRNGAVVEAGKQVDCGATVIKEGSGRTDETGTRPASDDSAKAAGKTRSATQKTKKETKKETAQRSKPSRSSAGKTGRDTLLRDEEGGQTI